MHIFTHLKKESDGKTGLGIYADGMVEHDGHVGQVLEKLRELGLEDTTIVMYSSDNGAETFTWPDGGTTMFRGEKNTQWKGGYRVPCLIKWPDVIKPGTVINDIGAHEDMLMTLVTAAGDKTAKEDLLSTDRFLFFDLGVPHAAAGLTAGTDTVRANPGPLFEQWVGIELWKRLQYLGNGKLHYLRTKDGAEVDFIIEHGGRFAPVEVK